MRRSIDNRGFTHVKFKDIYKHKCSLQESSLAEESAVWLGTECCRMHLNKKMAEELIKE
jgi:hypothetical protein